MTDTLHSIILIAITAVITALIRFLPFIVFRGDKPYPKVLDYLGNVLPGAVMGMLVIYCLKDTKVLAWPYALPELIAVAAVVLLHLWKKNTLLSVGVGTVLYMVLVQLVF